MRRIPPGALIVLALLANGATLPAQERTGTVNAAADARVRIDNPTGPTTVIGWERNEVQFQSSGGSARDVQIRTDGRRIDIAAPANTSLIVRVPKGAVLDVRSGSGPIHIRELENSIEAESGSGPISITGTPRRITATGFSGGVHIRGGGTEITRAESASGSVTVSNANGVVDLSSSSGSVVARGRIRDAKLFSVSGAVAFDGVVEAGGRVSAESSSGTVSVRLPENTAAEYELSTVNGHIRNAFGPRVERSGIGAGSSLRFSVGGGGARIRASSVSGSVILNSQ